MSAGPEPRMHLRKYAFPTSTPAISTRIKLSNVKSSLRTLFIFFTGLLPTIVAFGQTPALRGVVWQQPDDLREAISDLYEMRRVGVQAVRTDVIADERLLTVADGLGMQIFQEIPVENLTVLELQDTVAFAMRTLDQALARARQHPSARHFGLARMSDTSDPAACAYLEQLTQRVRQQGPERARTYYVTPFIKADACTGAVDLVLLNTLDAEDPSALLAGFVEQDSVRVGRTGIGALGTWVDDGAGPGVRIPHSPQSQARYLENNLNRLFDRRAPVQPYAVFVYRWSDPVGSDATGVGLTPVAYGLHGESTSRPALDVVRGIYTGSQLVFAFDQGGEPSGSWPWITLLGWSGIAVLGVFYAASPRLRFMIPRYFVAHGFYRDAVREGRDVLLGPSVALLATEALATGVLWSAVINAYAGEYAFQMLLRWTADPVRGLLMSAQSYPWVAVLIFAAVFVACALLWSIILVLLSRRRYALSSSQTMMLVVWSGWPLLLLLPAAMVVPALDADMAKTVSLTLLAIWGVVLLCAVVRTVYDFHDVTKVPVYFTLAAWLLNPYVLLVLALAVSVLFNVPEAAFLYHLLTRT